MFKRTKKPFIVAVALFTAMLLVVSACSKGGNSSNNGSNSTETDSASSESPGATTKEPVTITLWETSPVTPEGEQTDAVAMYIKEKLGITINVVRITDEKAKVLLASGDLPDILNYGSYRDQIIKGNILLPLDELVDKYGPDIKQNMGAAMEYSRKFKSTDGKLYALPIHTAPSFSDLEQAPAPFEYPYGNLIRWDYYKELGFPEIKSSDDMLKVLDQMVKKHPQTKDGKKVYGIAMNTDWGDWPWMWSATNLQGYQRLSKTIFIDEKSNAFDAMADENGVFFKTMNYYNKAYRMGLLDPESFTQKSDEVKTKIINGQVLSWTQNWYNTEINPALQKNFGPMAKLMVVPGGFLGIRGEAAATGWGTAYGITANSKHPDRAMELLNFFASYEGVRLAASGVKGVHWDIVDGKAQFKPDYFANVKNDPDYQKKNGFGYGSLYDHLVLIDGSVINPEDDSPFDLSMATESKLLQMTEADKDYSTHYGGQYPGEAYDNATPQQSIRLYNTVTLGSLPVIPDDLKRINDKVGSTVDKQIPKLVMSKTDADFAANSKELVAELQSLGVDKLNEWYTTEYEKAKAATEGM